MRADEIVEALLSTAKRVEEASARFYEKDKTGIKIELRIHPSGLLSFGGVAGKVSYAGQLSKTGGGAIVGADKISLNGFGDDGVVAVVVKIWAAARGWVHLEEHDDLIENHVNLYLDHRYLTWACFKEYVAEGLEEGRGVGARFAASGSIGPVAFISEKSGGYEVGSTYPRKDYEFKLSIEQLMKVADKEFTPRSELWLRVFHGVNFYGYSEAEFYDGQLRRELSCELADILSSAVVGVEAFVAEMFLELAYGYSSKLSPEDAAYLVAGALVL